MTPLLEEMEMTSLMEGQARIVFMAMQEMTRLQVMELAMSFLREKVIIRLISVDQVYLLLDQEMILSGLILGITERKASMTI